MSDPTIEPLPPGATLAPASDGVPRYVVEHVLGRGGFAITYVARDTRLNGTVVVKELACAAFARRAHDGRTIEPTRDGAGTHAALVDAAIREARTLNTLRDPRIVRVTDVFRENGTAYACMDRVVDAAPLPIGPLGRALTSANARRIEAVARGLLGALDVVHRAGIVHGDVKPDNVLVDADQHVVLIDFGTARMITDLRRTVTTTMFTRGYAPLELSSVVALRRAGRYDDAQQQVARLLRNNPDRLAFRIEAAEITLAKGDRAQAWRLFEKTSRLYPDDFTLAMHYGSALTTQGDPKRAMQLLQPHLRRHPNDPQLYATYAQAAQRAGDRAATYATMAEYYYLNGELLAAVDQLEAGLRNPGLSPNQEAQLRARLKLFKAEALAQDLPVSKSTTP